MTQQFLRGFLHLCNGLSFHVGHDEGIVVYLRGRFLLDHFQKRCGPQLAELRIDGRCQGKFSAVPAVLASAYQ